MHTPAPRSLWLVPERAPLTRGECGEDTRRESRGGGEGGRREPRPEGARSLRLLEGAAAAAGWKKVAPHADGN